MKERLNIAYIEVMSDLSDLLPEAYKALVINIYKASIQRTSYHSLRMTAKIALKIKNMK